MRKLICALIGAAALVASAATYIQTSSTGTAPWKPVKDSVSQARLADSARQADTARASWKADSARVAWFAHAATYADSSRVSGLADSARHAPPSAYADSSRVSGLADSAKRAGWAPRADSARAAGISDTAKKAGNAATSTKLATPRTISTTGDGAWSTSFDGSANATGALTLATLLTAGSAGSATAVPTLTWDAKGRLTAAGSAAISIPHTQISDWATSTTPSAIGALPYLLCSGPVDFNMINGKIPGAYQIFGSAYGSAPSGLTGNAGGGMLWQGCGANNVDWNAQVFVDAQQDALWYRTEGSPATWRSWHQLLTSTSSIPHTQISDWSTATSSFLTANQPISLTGAVTGSGTTSIATSFANMHLAGINQDLTTTSGPTFASATIGNGIYRAYAGANPSMGSIYAPGVAPGALNYVLAWEPNGNTSYLSGIVASYLCVNGAPVITATSSGASVTGTLTASGLITANGGISGNLTGHASLDIPLTGSSAITGSLISSNASNLGSASLPWGSVYGTTLYEGGVALSSKYLSSSSSSSLNLYGLILNNGGLSVQGTSLFMNKVTMQDDLTACYIKSWAIKPRSTGNYELGSGSAYWWGTYTNRLFCAIDLNAPSTATDVGIAGQIVFGSSYVYVCTATNTWRRAALATW